MPRRETRDRQRRARIERLRVEFDRLRGDPESLWGLLQRIASSDIRVWAVAEAAIGTLDEAEVAMVAQAAAPQLVRMTPGTARQRIVLKDWERSRKLPR